MLENKKLCDEYLINFYDDRAFKVWNYKFLKQRDADKVIIEALAILLGSYDQHRKRAALLLLKALIRDEFLEEILNDSIELFPISRNDKRVRNWTKKVLSRGYCEECGKSEGLEAHHIIKWSDYPWGRIDIKNGRCLCHRCHTEEHKGENVYNLMKASRVKKG